jgi:murein L,D-transpeptidase YcbB/YkuD
MIRISANIRAESRMRASAQYTALIVASVLAGFASVAAAQELLWFEGQRPTPAARALVEELRNAEARGLPDDAANLSLPASVPDAAARTRLDAELTARATRFIKRLHAGQIDPETVGFRIDAQRPALDVEPVLRALASSRSPDETARLLDELEPQWHRFALLKKALARYRMLAAQERPPLPDPGRRALRIDDVYSGAQALRAFLQELGDLPVAEAAQGGDEARIDVALSAALTRFQIRHGLTPDGILGPQTYRALTVPLSQRVRQIELTLERLRWLPPKLETAPLVVNIPQFKLFAFYTPEDREDQIRAMDVIVGRANPMHRTPVLAADLQYVVFNPYWDVPRNILIRELLPQIRAVPGWLEKNDFEVVWAGKITRESTPEVIQALSSGQARLRQRPGPNNALGRIKFIFPNRYDVYLHDTPATALFAASRRDFSHGCIRVSDARALAEYVLRETPGWTKEKIEAAFRDLKSTRVNLARPIRVFIIYATVMVAEDGTIYFFEDIYGHDARLEKALRAVRNDS